MSNLVFQDDKNYNLCRDYSSFIKWAIDKISKSTENWTDYSISEPDTLLLSSISTVSDYVQYIIDQMYLSTDLDVCSSQFLHQASAMMGKYLWGTNEIRIPITIRNTSTSETVEFSEFEMFCNGSELFTNPESLKIYPNSEIRTYFVRNTVNQKIYKISSNNIGEYILNGNVERASVKVYGISEDGQQTILNPCDNILELLINADDHSYQITAEDYQSFRIKLSPRSYQRFTAILVKYTLVDDYPVKSGFKLQHISGMYQSLVIQTADSVSIVSDRTINSGKLEYVRSLGEIDVLCSQKYLVELGELSKKINHHMLIYEPISANSKLATFKYSTINNLPLLGDLSNQGTSYIVDIMYEQVSNTTRSNYSITRVILTFDEIPEYDLVFEYTTTSGASEKLLIDNYTFKNSLVGKNYSIDLYDLLEISTLLIGFNGINCYYKYQEPDVLSQNPTSYQLIGSELDSLWSIFSQDILIDHQLPEVIFLKPQYLNLESTIVVQNTYDYRDLITRIVAYLDELLIHGDLITNTYLSYNRLEVQLLDHFDEIYDINISAVDKFVVNPDQYLVLKSVDEYLNEITIKSRGDN